MIEYIPLNEERIKVFLSLYDIDSSEYKYAFEDRYNDYLEKK